VGVTEQVGELALAEQKLAGAHVAMKHKRYRQARMLAEQAEPDARLAEARTLDEQSRTEVAEVNLQIERLRQQPGLLPCNSCSARSFRWESARRWRAVPRRIRNRRWIRRMRSIRAS